MILASIIRSHRLVGQLSSVWTLRLLFFAGVAFLSLLGESRAQAPAPGTGKVAAATPAEARANCDVILTKMGLNKIQVIKQVRDAVPGLGLAEAKTLVESAPKLIKRGVTAAEAEAIKQRVEGAGATVTIEATGVQVTAEPVVAAATPPAQGAAARCDVILTETGPNKIAVIKEVRAAMPGLGLAEAKMIAESAPRLIREEVTRQEAEVVKRKIEAAGATVVIREKP